MHLRCNACGRSSECGCRHLAAANALAIVRVSHLHTCLWLQNPEVKDPPNLGLQEKAQFSAEQQKHFRGLRWTDCQVSTGRGPTACF